MENINRITTQEMPTEQTKEYPRCLCASFWDFVVLQKDLEVIGLLVKSFVCDVEVPIALKICFAMIDKEVNRMAENAKNKKQRQREYYKKWDQQRLLKTSKDFKNFESIAKNTIKQDTIKQDTIKQDTSIKEKNNIKKESEKKESEQIPPTVEMVAAYCARIRANINAQNFVDFYESKGWLVGKTRMKNWQAAVRTWVRGDKERESSRNATNQSVGFIHHEQGYKNRLLGEEG